jgi:glycosyltransferase involved in cell wall biosynthesis
MGDYHRARWKALEALIGTDNCYAADYGAGDGLYLWNNTSDSVNHLTLSNKPVDKVPVYEAFINFKKAIKRHEITHVCIPGYGRPAYILMLIWCRLVGIKTLLFAESWYPGNSLFDWLKGLLIRNTVSICFVSGKRAAYHFSKRLRYPAHKIVEGYSVVDNNHFMGVDKPTIPKPTPPQLLCVARHAPEKNLALLIQAFQKSELCNTWQLRIIGGGPLKEELKSLITTGNVQLDDWLSYNKLPEMYASATCFILPSRFEPWGLVVNEAMAAGLPIILSDAVGALPDLLREDINGWQFDHQSESSCIECLNKLANSSNQQLNEMGQISREIISEFTPGRWAEGVLLERRDS